MCSVPNYSVFWTVVNNKVYDITDFLDKHPGGDIVKYCAGRDGTDLLESYHPAVSQIKALNALDKYYIGELANALPLPDDKFLVTVRARVEARLKENGWGRHFYEYIALFEVLATTLLYLFFSAKIATTGSYWYAIPVGLLTGRLGFFMHMGNHRAMSTNATINEAIEKLMDLIGGSSKIWTHEHAVAHHLTPNQLWSDNDCSIGYPFMRFHPGLEWKPHHVWQAPLTVAAITFGTMKWYFTDVFDFLKGHVGSQRFFTTQRDWTILLGFKGFWFLLHVLWPAVNHSVGFALTSALLLMAVSSHYIENIFIINHIQDNLVPANDLHWAEKQIIGSADWSVGSYFWNWFSGGLNHQTVHHLFPSISHYCYPAVAKIVADTAREFGLRYNEFDNIATCYWSMIMYLHKLGKPPGHPEHVDARHITYIRPDTVQGAKTKAN